MHYIAVAAGKQNRNLRITVADFLCQCNPVHAAGHDDIAENKSDVVAALQPVQSVHGIVGAQNLIAELLYEGSTDVGDVRIVLDDKNRTMPGHNRLRGRRRHGLDERCLPTRQVDCDRRAAADRAGRNDGTPRLMRKAVDLRQSEAGAFPERLGREERLENSRQDVRCDADPGIGHRQGNEVSFELIDTVAFPQGDVERRQRDDASAGHRVTRIDRNVDQRQLELRDIDFDRPDICRYVALERNVSA